MTVPYSDAFGARAASVEEGCVALKKLSPPEIERIALREGFRTTRSFLAWWQDHVRAVRLFATDPDFGRLWELVEAAEDVSGQDAMPPEYYADRVLDGLRDWHVVPRLTKSELAAALSRVSRLCTQLEDELVKLTPAGTHGHFGRFWFSRSQGARGLERFGLLSDGAPSKVGAGGLFSRKLRSAGVTPLWCIRNIRIQANEPPYPAPLLPRKMRAVTAKRTYLIRLLSQGLGDTSLQPGFHARLVSLLVDGDCDADDVRKVTTGDQVTRQKEFALEREQAGRAAGLGRAPATLEERRSVAEHDRAQIEREMARLEDLLDDI